MLKQFCPHCGYKTLERVVVTVDADGNRIYRGRRKPMSTKGLRVSFFYKIHKLQLVKPECLQSFLNILKESNKIVEKCKEINNAFMKI